MPGFCRSELNNFRQLLGPEYNIERTEYILDSGKRCTYKIEKYNSKINPMIISELILQTHNLIETEKFYSKSFNWRLSQKRNLQFHFVPAILF